VLDWRRISGVFAVAQAQSAVIIGGGHNGLVCAFYLARAGLRVTVCERRGVVGGAAVTEEFHPGFRNSVASYTVSLLHQRVIDDMGLYGHGLRIVERPIANFLPTADGRYLKMGGGVARMSPLRSMMSRSSVRGALGRERRRPKRVSIS